MAEPILGIYTGPALNTAASNVIELPTVDGTIYEVELDLSDVTNGDALYALYEDGVLVSNITVSDTTEIETVSGLSYAMTNGKVLSLSLLSPLPTTLPAPPWSLKVRYTSATDIPYTHASSSSAAYLDFKEDTDNGTNRARLIGPASTADVTITLPSTTGTLALTAGTTYTETNVTPDRSYDANATTLDEVADVLGTLIADLRAAKIIN